MGALEQSNKDRNSMLFNQVLSLNSCCMQISLGVRFTGFASVSGPPRVHPIIQLMTAEWKDASRAGRKPQWNKFSDEHITEACAQVSSKHPDWHPDLYATDLSRRLRGTPPASRWWICPPSESSIPQGSEDGA